jgi:hypothetical protein
VILGAGLITWAGCSRNDPKSTAATPQADTTVASPAPRRTTSDVDLSFLELQIKRGDQVRQQIEQLRQARPRDDARLRELIVKRKGEVLNAKKMVRDSDRLSPEQKDLMLGKLDEEAIDLAQDLVAVSP